MMIKRTLMAAKAALLLFTRLILTVLFLFSPSTVIASTLSEGDLFGAGDALLTYDSSTDLQWLDVTVTAGLSYEDVVNGVGNDWLDGYGFRYASVNEVDQFFRQSGWDGVPDWRPESFLAATAILELWGSMASIQAGADFVGAITGDDAHGSSSKKLYSIVSLSHPSGTWGNVMPVATSGSSFYCAELGLTEPCPIGIPVDQRYNLRGHALVRAYPLPGCGPSGGVPPKCNPDISPVPLPAALPLLGAGIGGLGFMGRRKKKAA